MKKSYFLNSSAELRASADAMVARWRELDAHAKTKLEEANEYVKRNPSVGGVTFKGRSTRVVPGYFDFLMCSLKVSEAQVSAADAERDAALALDAAERAEGDELASLRDLHQMRADLVLELEHVADAERAVTAAQTALTAARARMNGRVQKTLAANASVSARRAALGLPYVQVRLPISSFGKAPLVALDEAIAGGLPSLRTADSDREAVRVVAALLEETRRDQEKEKADSERTLMAREYDDERKRQHQRAEAQATLDANAAEKQRRDELADSYIARQANGGGH